MICPARLTEAGVLPLKDSVVRFAIGSPLGVSSNAWRVWASKHGDVYLTCRDNFREAKVSLHTSGRWRMGFTSEAIAKTPDLIGTNENRAWEVWDRPPQILPQTVIAFRLIFLGTELAVLPEQRKASVWKEVVFIEAPPPGKLTVVTLFVAQTTVVLRHESEPSFCLATLNIGNDLTAQLIAHGDPEGDWPELLERSVTRARAQAEASGVKIPVGAYGYFFGHRDDGARFLMGARFDRPNTEQR